MPRDVETPSTHLLLSGFSWGQPTEIPGGRSVGKEREIRVFIPLSSSQQGLHGLVASLSEVLASAGGLSSFLQPSGILQLLLPFAPSNLWVVMAWGTALPLVVSWYTTLFFFVNCSLMKSSPNYPNLNLPSVSGWDPKWYRHPQKWQMSSLKDIV